MIGGGVDMKGLFMRALENREKVVVMYIDGNNRITKRVIKVVKMSKDHLLVYCYFRKKLRTLKMDNILSAEPVKMKLGA